MTRQVLLKLKHLLDSLRFLEMDPSRETQLQSSKAIQQPETHSSKTLSTDPLMIPITHLYHHNIPTVQKIRHIKHSCMQKFENKEIYCKKKKNVKRHLTWCVAAVPSLSQVIKQSSSAAYQCKSSVNMISVQKCASLSFWMPHLYNFLQHICLMCVIFKQLEFYNEMNLCCDTRYICLFI